MHLSISFLPARYSVCHWCHVMERESFESEEVAQLMNANFVSVKVDREERPDVDKVGGWVWRGRRWAVAMCCFLYNCLLLLSMRHCELQTQRGWGVSSPPTTAAPAAAFCTAASTASMPHLCSPNRHNATKQPTNKPPPGTAPLSLPPRRST